MPIGAVCTRDVVVAGKEMTIQDAARLMRHHHVGNIVVVDEVQGRSIPVGIITDRDIVLSVIAMSLDPAIFTLGDLATNEVVTAPEEQGVFESIHQMRVNGVRRMPIVNRHGELVGIISVDDLIQLLSDELQELSNLIAREQAQEIQSRR
jgi:CBS domain-containing protein